MANLKSTVGEKKSVLEILVKIPVKSLWCGKITQYNKKEMAKVAFVRNLKPSLNWRVEKTEMRVDKQDLCPENLSRT